VLISKRRGRRHFDGPTEGAEKEKGKERAMKSAKWIYAALIAALAPTAGALAAPGTREEGMGMLMWAFLGFCALVIAAQAIPAIVMALSAVRGVAEGIREKRRATAESKAGA
jgi:hypothetical protein